VAGPPADALPGGGPDAITYAGNPGKRGLDLVCDAWRAAAPPGARLAIGGVEREAGLRWLRKAGSLEPDGVEWLGKVDRDRWLALVASAGLYLNGSRFEEWGLAQMETLGAGTPLVTVPTPGPNAALALARRLAPQLVAGESTPGALAGALRNAFRLDAGSRKRYAEQAEGLLAPYRDEPLRRRVAEEVLPALLASSSS
jgi:glycosyltransferase involved in cell wall biosynthesis